MDAATEDACLKALHEQVTKDNTMVLVTHKPSMLALVQRVILVVNNQIIMDGPRDEVLSRLSAGGQNSSQVAGQS
jgi:ATP-binding cassette subfamily C protein LapB